MARTLDDVKKTHGPRDYETDFRNALKSIPAGQYETTAELCQRTGISTKQIPVMQPKFAAHSVRVKNRAREAAWMWARTPADARRLQDALKAQNG